MYLSTLTTTAPPNTMPVYPHFTPLPAPTPSSQPPAFSLCAPSRSFFGSSRIVGGTAFHCVPRAFTRSFAKPARLVRLSDRPACSLTEPLWCQRHRRSLIDEHGRVDVSSSLQPVSVRPGSLVLLLAVGWLRRDSAYDSQFGAVPNPSTTYPCTSNPSAAVTTLNT